jgi:Cysteine rich repeat
MRRALLGLLAGLAVCQASAANAQQPSQAQANAIRQSCRGDYQAHCAGVPTGGSAALQCLKENMASLSPACQSAVSATRSGTAATAPAGAASQAPAAPTMTPREQAMAMRRACGGDFRRYCPGVALGGGRALACLADHRESLSPPCQEALASARGR